MPRRAVRSGLFISEKRGEVRFGRDASLRGVPSLGRPLLPRSPSRPEPPFDSRASLPTVRPTLRQDPARQVHGRLLRANRVLAMLGALSRSKAGAPTPSGDRRRRRARRDDRRLGFLPVRREDAVSPDRRDKDELRRVQDPMREQGAHLALSEEHGAQEQIQLRHV